VIRTEVLHKRLNKLDEYLHILRTLQRYDIVYNVLQTKIEDIGAIKGVFVQFL